MATGTKLERFREELTCSICNALYEEPKTLPCLHTFCAKCLEDHIKKRPLDRESGDTREKFKCPLCNELVNVPKADVSTLRTNRSYKNLVHHLTVEDKVTSEEGAKCEDCEEGNSTFYCKTCSMPLCEGCQQHHAKSKRTRDHVLVPAKDVRAQSSSSGSDEAGPDHQTWQCAEHKSEVCIYCIKCDMVICRDCALVGHNDHKKDFAGKLIGDFQPDIEKRLRETSGVEGTFTNAINALNEMKESLKQSKEETSQAVVKRYGEIKRELDRQQDELLRKVNDIFTRKTGRLDEQLQELQDIDQTLQDGIKFVTDVLRVGIPEEILFLRTQIEVRLKELCEEYGPYPRDARDNDIINFGENKQLNLTDAIGTVCADPHASEFTADGVEDVHFIKGQTAKFTVNPRDIIGTPLKEKVPDYNIEVRIEAVTEEDGGGTAEREGGEGGRRADGERGEGGGGEGGGEGAVGGGGGGEGGEGGRGGGGGGVGGGGGERGGVGEGEPRELAQIEVTKGANGKHVVSITPREDGRFRLSITVLTKPKPVHIKNSPFTINVAPRLVPPSPAPGRSSGRGIIQASTVIKGETIPGGKMRSPWGVAVSRNGDTIAVSDIDTHCILIFDQAGTFVRAFGKEGRGQLEFRSPRGLAFNAGGHIVVAEKDNNRVQIVTPQGQFKRKFGEPGSNRGQFHNPTDVAIGKDGTIFVTDSINQRIQFFKPDGTPLGMFGRWGAELNMVNEPYAITLDSRGHVFVTERQGCRVQVFEKAGQTYQSAGQFGSRGSSDQHLDEPVGIAHDTRNNYVFITELRNQRVSVFGANGSFFTTFGGLGSDPGQFHNPLGIEVLNDSRVIVADCGNNRLLIFPVLDRR